MKSRWVFCLLGGLVWLSLMGCRTADILCKAGPAGGLSGVESGRISIAWEPNKERNLSGYRIYYGPSPEKYGNCVDIGNPTESSPGAIQYTLEGLSKGEKYYISVIAYDRNNKKSNFSKEVSGIAK